jgi:hypothetical protein
MRRILLLALLVLPACLDYEIVVVTVVRPDGTAARTLSIREKGEKKTWKLLDTPAAPYATEGDDEKGFGSKAEWKPGTHPSGLRVRLGDAEKTPAPPTAEGTVTVEARNLLVGTRFRYEEQIANGADPERFREALPKWTELGLRYTLETLKIAFPDIDFTEVEKKARAELLPALDRAIKDAYFSAQELFANVLKDFAPLAVTVTLPEGLPWDDDTLEAAMEKAARQMAERALAPLKAEERAKVIEALFSGDALAEAADETQKRLFPDDDKLGDELQAFASDAFGAYLAYGFFDEVRMRFRVELPGVLLRANGELSGLPAVGWRVGKGDLVLSPPVLSATSFLPSEGVPGAGWTEETLDRIAEALDAVPAERMPALEELVQKALRVGWPDDAPGVEGEEAQAAYDAIHDAVKALAKAK